MSVLDLAGLACASCVFDPDSELVQGARLGVLFLGGVILFVLAAIVGVTVFWANRAKMLAASAEFDAKPAMNLYDRPR